jgi:hypothetical protein
MNLRDHASNIMDNLIASGIYSAAILVAVRFWPRIVTKFTALRVAAALVPTLLIVRLRALAALLRRRARVGQLTGISHATSQSYGSLIDATPEPMPPGTASAIVMAMQPPINRSPMLPAFLNNSMMMQSEAEHYRETGALMAMQAHERELERAARFAMRSTMPGFSAATLN